MLTFITVVGMETTKAVQDNYGPDINDLIAKGRVHIKGKVIAPGPSPITPPLTLIRPSLMARAAKNLSQ